MISTKTISTFSTGRNESSVDSGMEAQTYTRSLDKTDERAVDLQSLEVTPADDEQFLRQLNRPPMTLDVEQTTPPPKNSVWTLEECGPRARVPLSEDPEGAVCGMSYVIHDHPGKKIYCTAAAPRESQAGQWSCSKHVCRASADPSKKP